jgi:hypothetical protein
MARDKGHLTDLQLRHWIKAGKPLAKADGDGLTFTLSAADMAGWILRYRHGGRRRELTIGRYPDIGLAEARGIATLKRAEVQQGRNPAAEKQKAKATAARDWTVRDLAKDYRAKKLVSLAHSTQVTYGRHLKRISAGSEPRRLDPVSQWAPVRRLARFGPAAALFRRNAAAWSHHQARRCLPAQTAGPWRAKCVDRRSPTRRCRCQVGNPVAGTCRLAQGLCGAGE